MSSVAIEYFKNIDESKIKLIKHELQYDFFLSEEESEVERLIKQMTALKFSTERVRKALFARNNELDKQVTELQERLALLERFICRGGDA